MTLPHPSSTHDFLADALAAARAGQRAEARSLLWKALRTDPRRSAGWLLLASVVDTLEDVQTCLHQVLYLEPGNTLARGWLDRVESWPDPSTAPPPPAWPEPASPAAAAPPPPAATVAMRIEPRRAQLLTLPERQTEPSPQPNPVPTAAVASPAVSPPAATATNQPTPSAPAAKPRPRILVVDDSATVRRIVAIALERLGCEVATAENGLEALARISQEEFHLLLLDIGLPNLDGYQVAKVLRSTAKGRELPIVMLSGRDGIFDKVRGRLAGAAEYLTKPVDASTLRAALSRHLTVSLPELP
jgi:twitching motility two-component system response regulator PilG